jgi:hypothetical protein
MATGPIKVIQEAIKYGNIDDKWKLEPSKPLDISLFEKKKSPPTKISNPSLAGPKKEILGLESFPKPEVEFRANYQNATGNTSLSFRGERWGNQFRLFSSTFTTDISGRKVELDDTSSGTKGSGPDGKISARDSITVDGRNYVINEYKKGYYRLEDLGESEIGKAFRDKGKAFSAGPYHDLQFTREGDKWKFIGPPERSVQGQEAEKLINELQNQYKLELMDAQTHLR